MKGILFFLGACVSFLCPAFVQAQEFFNLSDNFSNLISAEVSLDDGLRAEGDNIPIIYSITPGMQSADSNNSPGVILGALRKLDTGAALISRLTLSKVDLGVGSRRNAWSLFGQYKFPEFSDKMDLALAGTVEQLHDFSESSKLTFSSDYAFGDAVKFTANLSWERLDLDFGGVIKDEEIAAGIKFVLGEFNPAADDFELTLGHTLKNDLGDRLNSLTLKYDRGARIYTLGVGSGDTVVFGATIVII